MTRESTYVLIRGPDISVIDQTIARPRCEDVVVPRQCPNTIRMANHRPKSTTMLRIPNLHETFACTNCEMCTLE